MPGINNYRNYIIKRFSVDPNPEVFIVLKKTLKRLENKLIFKLILLIR